MKKILTIVAILLVIVGCTSSSEDESVDSVVGIWKLTSIKTMGQEFINACKSKDNIEVRSDKTFTITGHNEDDNCAPQIASGSWVISTNNTYKFTANGDIQTFTLNSSTLTFSIQGDSNAIVYSYKK
tara:strand:+ start:197 stop:577 length:381 start_codon:yes stop_codon:yes gene_type:complete